MEEQHDLGILRITTTDDRYTVRGMLRRVSKKHVLLVLPWEASDRGWNTPLDFEFLLRFAREQELNVAAAIEDPDRRALAREVGFPVFSDESDAYAHFQQHRGFPTRRRPPEPKPQVRPPWAEDPEPRPLPVHRRRRWWHWTLEGLLAIIVLAFLGGFAFLLMPSASVRLTPKTVTYNLIVPVSVDPALEDVDIQRTVIPSHRIGDEFESYAEIRPAGQSYAFSGKATGEVIFTNLLGQAYSVPRGTLVRTSGGSFPVRFLTTQDITVPPLGQERAPVEATEEGPRGNVDAYQINFVEGVAGFALKVTNPTPITGAESQIVATVSEADKERLWNIVAQQVLDAAYGELLGGGYLEPGEFLPRQTLVIQATPKEAFTHITGEQTDVLGLSLRLLVTGEAVRARDVQAVAFRHLVQALPEGYSLAEMRFEVGESAEEDVGPGRFTFYVNAHALATASLDLEAARRHTQGLRIDDARKWLSENLPLARPADVTIEPEWFPFMPRLAMRTEFESVKATWNQ